ncbi:electron transfer flavoprotein alpha subunit, partial [Paragonimus westermani]
MENLNTISAAENFGKVSCLVAGFKCGRISGEVASISGVTRVLVAGDVVYENGIAEKLTLLVLAAQSKVTASYLVVGCSTFGRDLIPRVAAKLHVSPINDVIAIHGVDTFQRPIYAGNALVTLKSLDPIKCLAIRATAFLPTTTEKPALIEPISTPSSDAEAINLVDFVSVKRHKSDRPELNVASIVIPGDRGLKSGDNFKLLYHLADKLNAAIGASRAAVDAGFAPNDMQIDQAGKIVAPKLYIAIGISGAIQHLAGNPLETVDSFTYLGSTISSACNIADEISARIAKARVAFSKLRHLWRRKDVRLSLKGRVYNACVRSILLYGSETWPVRKQDINRLAVFDHRCLRHLAHIKWADRVSNAAVRRRVFRNVRDARSIGQVVTLHSLRWLGHVLRMPAERLPYRALYTEGTSDWVKPRGGQATTWSGNMKTLTAPLSKVGRHRLPGWGPRDHSNRWLETLSEMA